MLLLVMITHLFIGFMGVTMTATSLACDHHVHSTWDGNSSCLYSRDSGCKVFVNCRLWKMTSLSRLISQPDVVYSLDLSHNSIRYIQRNAFNGLRNLKVLDLSFNSLLTWDTWDITSQLPSLTELNVIGNPSWLPGQHIRDLPNLTVIKGIASYIMPYLDYCVYCNIHKKTDALLGDALSPTPHLCLKASFSFPENYTTLWHSKFSIVCIWEVSKNHPLRQASLFNRKPSNFTIDLSDVCFPEINKWGLPNIPIGLTVITINVVVMATVFLTPRLKKKTSMLLIAKLALGDFLQGVWLIMLTLTRYSKTSFEFVELKMPVVCYCYFALFVAAQGLSVGIGVLVTLERYLSIVYSTKPHMRMTPRTVLSLVIVVWLGIILASVLPFFTRMESPFYDYSCTNLLISKDQYYLAYLGLIVTLLYLTSYALYARIFYTVRQASLNVGMQREGRLAKRIITMITTNLLFLGGPTVASQALRLVSEVTFVMRIICWHAILLWMIGINSCLNPLIYAFRIQRFRASVKRLFKCRPNAVGTVNSRRSKK